MISIVRKGVMGIVVPIWLTGASFSVGNVSSSLTTPVDFSGSWTLNSDKTDFGPGSKNSTPLSMRIQQGSDSLTVERTAKRGNGEVTTYVEKFSIKGGSVESMIKTTKKIASIEWAEDGQSLTEKASYKDYSIDIEYKGSETWTLLDNGQTLSIDRQDVMPDGVTSAKKMVYNKVAPGNSSH